MNKSDLDDPEFLEPTASSTIGLSNKAWQQFEQILDNPPPATEELKKLMCE